MAYGWELAVIYSEEIPQVLAWGCYEIFPMLLTSVSYNIVETRASDTQLDAPTSVRRLDVSDYAQAKPLGT